MLTTLARETSWQIRIYLRDRVAVFFTFAFPMLLLFFWSRQEENPLAITALVAGLALAMAGYAGLAMGMAAAREGGCSSAFAAPPYPNHPHFGPVAGGRGCGRPRSGADAWGGWGGTGSARFIRKDIWPATGIAGWLHRLGKLGVGGGKPCKDRRGGVLPRERHPASYVPSFGCRPARGATRLGNGHTPLVTAAEPVCRDPANDCG